MKLNLGCGRLYKLGFVNIDAWDSAIADVNMSATDLKYSDNSVELIEGKQIIEHLGYIQSIYCLSECFRVLESKGNLLIETPDIETAFKIFIKGKRKERENVAPWIFGIESPGMLHKFCFPLELLCEILYKLGFVNIKVKFLRQERYHPILKISCQKPEVYQASQIISVFRKKLNVKGIIELNNEIIASEQEKLIDFFSTKLLGFLKNNTKEDFEQVIYGCIKDPNMTMHFLKECLKNDIEVEKLLELADLLDKYNFCKHLTFKLTDASIVAGEQDIIFEETVRYGKKCIDKISSGVAADTVVQVIEKGKIDLSIPFFSKEIIRHKADEFFHIGIKSFLLKDYEDAIRQLRTSAKLYRDNIFTFWNLARLNIIKNNLTEAKGFYKDCEILLNKYRYKNQSKIRRNLRKEEKEMCLIRDRNEITPLIDIDNSRNLTYN